MQRRTSSLPAPQRGEIWLAQLDKLRPVVVLTRDPMGRILNSVIIAPISSRVRGLAVEVPIGPDDGIDVDSAANLDNLQVIRRGRLVRRVGSVQPRTMAHLCSALAVATGCM